MRPVLVPFLLSLLSLGRRIEMFHSLLRSAPSRPSPPASVFIWGVPSPRPTARLGSRGGDSRQGGGPVGWGRGGPGPVPTRPPRRCRLRGPPQMLRRTRGLFQQTAYSLQTRQQQQQKAHMVKIRKERAFCLRGLATTSQKCRALNLNFWWASAGLTT